MHFCQYVDTVHGYVWALSIGKLHIFYDVSGRLTFYFL